MKATKRAMTVFLSLILVFGLFAALPLTANADPTPNFDPNDTTATITNYGSQGFTVPVFVQFMGGEVWGDSYFDTAGWNKFYNPNVPPTQHSIGAAKFTVTIDGANYPSFCGDLGSPGIDSAYRLDDRDISNVKDQLIAALDYINDNYGGLNAWGTFDSGNYDISANGGPLAQMVVWYLLSHSNSASTPAITGIEGAAGYMPTDYNDAIQTVLDNCTAAYAAKEASGASRVTDILTIAGIHTDQGYQRQIVPVFDGSEIATEPSATTEPAGDGTTTEPSSSTEPTTVPAGDGTTAAPGDVTTTEPTTAPTNPPAAPATVPATAGTTATPTTAITPAAGATTTQPTTAVPAIAGATGPTTTAAPAIATPAQTGDNSNFLLYLLIATLAALTAAAVLLVPARQRR